jgi:FSR family fosmidomycin resistance protein-like MFS transporter
LCSTFVGGPTRHYAQCGLGRPSRPMMARSVARRTLLASCTAHALHDGYTDLTYVLLPIWRAEFAIGYAMVAALRGLYSGAMASLQVPAGRMAERFGGRPIMVLGTVVAALGYILAGVTGSLIGLSLALAASGAGASVQHPIGSSAVSRAYASGGARQALGTYNFSGDLGKATIPALLSLLLTFVAWRTAVCWMAVAGLVVAAIVAAFMPSSVRTPTASARTARRTLGATRGAFSLLMAIGILDTGVRVGLLTFLPFVLERKGATVPTIGLALALVFVGGAAGKFTCGWLGHRLGVLWTVILTEGGTAVSIAAVLLLSLHPTLVLLPLLGVMLNGTSSVLYGTVPELVAEHRAERAFALFYTGTIGSAALSPVLFGFLGDVVGPMWASAATAVTALATLPLVLGLAPRLSVRPPSGGS